MTKYIFLERFKEIFFQRCNLESQKLVMKIWHATKILIFKHLATLSNFRYRSRSLLPSSLQNLQLSSWTLSCYGTARLDNCVFVCIFSRTGGLILIKIFTGQFYHPLKVLGYFFRYPKNSNPVNDGTSSLCRSVFWEKAVPAFKALCSLRMGTNWFLGTVYSEKKSAV